jgi:hypothetical protein
MEVTELKYNTILKGRCEELLLIPTAYDDIQSWKSLPQENFPNLRKFAQLCICRFASTYLGEQAF